MKIELTLTKRQAEAVLRSQGLSSGHGVQRSDALAIADMRIRHAIVNALSSSAGSVGETP